MGFLSWLLPGNDHDLADDYATERRTGHRRHIRDAADAGEAWENRDRARDRRGGTRDTDWND